MGDNNLLLLPTTTTTTTNTTTNTTISIFLFTILLLIIPYLHFIQKKRNVNNNNKDDETIVINPCPNPNCVRCQKYKLIQSNAKRRLPHLIHHHWKKSDQRQLDRTSKEFQLQRIVDGVHNNIKKNERTSGQHPTVLFIPRLEDHPVPSIVTHLHSRACHAFLTADRQDDDNHDHNPATVSVSVSVSATNTALSSNTSSSSSSSIRDVMLQEYLDSQISNNAQWTTNNIGTISSNVNVNSNLNKNNNTYTSNKDNNDTDIDDDHLWEVLYLMNQGQWIQENIQFCPQTYSFLTKKLDGLLMQNCIFGNIFFSVLYPGTVIEPHCGPTNIRHRLHFSLSIPSCEYNGSSSGHGYNNDDSNCDNDSPILKVRTDIMKWEDETIFVFDDSLVHSAEYPNKYNKNSEVRVVLVVDLWHPSLSSADERDLLTGLYPHM